MAGWAPSLLEGVLGIAGPVGSGFGTNSSDSLWSQFLAIEKSMSKNGVKHLFRTIVSLCIYFVLYYLSFRIKIQPEPCGSSHLSDADESVVPPRSRVDCMDCVVSARGRSTFSCREGQCMSSKSFWFSNCLQGTKPGT